MISILSQCSDRDVELAQAKTASWRQPAARETAPQQWLILTQFLTHTHIDSQILEVFQYVVGG